MEEEAKKEKNEDREPKIDELEKLVSYFRQTFGEEPLMASIKDSKIKDIIARSEVSDNIPSKSNDADIPIEDTNFPESSTEPLVYSKLNSKIERYPDLSKENIFRNDQGFSFRKIWISIRNALKLKRYRYPLITLGVFFGIFIAFNLPVYYAQISYQEPQTTKTIVKTQETHQRQMADSAILDPGEVIPTESRLVIPKINVNVPIVYLESRVEEDIQKALHNGVVHYQGTAKPGEIGNSFITGHSSNYWWDPGKYNYVFVLLDRLEAGDKVIAYYNNRKFVYTVRDKVVVLPTDVGVLAPTQTPVMSLMTCTPPGTSWKRLIVRLDRTDPAYYEPELITKEKIVEVPIITPKKRSVWESILSIFIPN